MKHERPTEEMQTLAALYALGALDPHEAREFEAHLKEFCPRCEADIHAFEAVASQLALSQPAVAPRPQVREQLLARISREAPDLMAECGMRNADLKSASSPNPPSAIRHPPSENPQVWKTWTPTPEQPRWVVRAHEGEWQDTGIDGVLAKNLFVDDERQCVTMLVRMMPGARYPKHRHADAELCYVVQGDLWMGDQKYEGGDYIHARPGSIDEEQFTKDGCLLFIVSSQRDELLARL
jgi:anti-sigma factor ChrR (cupin superfamily)